MTHTQLKRYFVLTAVLLATTTALLGQGAGSKGFAKLKVQADPRNAFVFVDGEAYKQHDGMLEIDSGEHTIGVYSYGFAPFTEKVTLHAGDNPVITAKLEPRTGQVDGTWGNLQIKGINGDYLVFLNGRSPDFYVGRVSEVSGNRLALPPGTQHVIIVRPEGNQEVNAWYVKIMANKRAVYHADEQQTWYEPWSEAAQMHSLPLYQANTMAVAPVHAQLTSMPAVAGCNQPVHLVWNTTGYNTMMKKDGVAIGNGGGVGEQIVDPKQTTTYYLETFGPGGVIMTPYTVQVNPAVKASLTVSPGVIRYHKVGDKVLEAGTTTLNWTASNAETVRVDPIGLVNGTSGQETIAFTPTKADIGPVNETRVYRITASNSCGGSDTTTAVVEIAGSIDPAEPVVVASAEPLPPVLPQTGSSLPLIGLLGFLALGSGLVLRRFVKS
jgi:LPXTG-motif cell wall-anchored protein